jgi:hypothetical protein
MQPEYDFDYRKACSNRLAVEGEEGARAVVLDPDIAQTGIAKVCTKVSIHAQQSDFAYWQAQPYQARLAALEQIRQEFHRWKYGAEPRLQRVYSVAKR